MNDTKPEPTQLRHLHPPSFPLLESQDHGRTFIEAWFGGASPLAALFADPTVAQVELTDKFGDVRTYRRVTR